MQHVHGLSSLIQVHRHHRELQAAPALKERHRVVVRNAQHSTQCALSIVADGFELRRPVAHFHYGHARAAIIKQFSPHAFQHRKRQRPRPGIEIEGSLCAVLRGCQIVHRKVPWREVRISPVPDQAIRHV